MIRKFENYNRLLGGNTNPAARTLEEDGHAFLSGVFSQETIDALRDEISEVFRSVPPDLRDNCREPDRGAMFRYEMFNRSARCQEILGRREILDAIEPVLGDDCHVVACTAWRNPPGTEHAPYGQEWHVDGGPHVVRPEGVPWPEEIPYPIFMVAAHVYLWPCGMANGPTAVIPGSHRSGRLPPHARRWDLDLTYEGKGGLAHVAEPGDVGFFVSDSWHRRLPPQEGSEGRYFLQINYGRREIAQRILPCERLNASNEAARARAGTLRQRQLLGLHEQGFYDG
ncbi:MAG: phytanoyl-CoA dioxygenase family protein [Planctomycetota bacterium]